MIPNHGLVLLEDIGKSNAQSLLCLTNRTDCCRHHAIGNWYFPNGTQIPNNRYKWDIYRSRGPGVVRMHRRRGGVTGIYSCKVPDSNGVIQTLNVGVYTTNTGQLTIYPHGVPGILHVFT